MRDSPISWLLSGAVGFFASKGAEVMWPDASPWEWWGVGAALFVLLMIYSHRFWLRRRIYLVAAGIVNEKNYPKEIILENADFQKKRQDAISAMKIIVEALDDMAQRQAGPAPMQAIMTSYDHFFVVYKDKYASWFPEKALNREQMTFWCERIETILIAHDYPEAEKIIKTAARRGAWH